MMGARSTLAREFDVETGLVHMGARDYDPDTGRFLQEDPEPPYSNGALMQPKNLNLFAYAWNSPLRYIDPDGTRPMDSMSWDRYSDAMLQPNWKYSGPMMAPAMSGALLSCMGACIQERDPLDSRLLGQMSLSVGGGTYWKSWIGEATLLKSKPYTTIPSALELRYGWPVRGVGRVFSPLWIGYGDYMAGATAYCSLKCASNPNACQSNR